ncbi:retrovirus-related Pol polyprotein from transposon 412 [Trichonephila clavipes]|nr:retrovirus-related Pol polyprotein from transposon 412 [Trichonephila clavipes]
MFNNPANIETKPFIIRTDASSYALGAVLLQGESPTDEQPVEYASRLLSSAEKNYSTTEREALAVVWALEDILKGQKLQWHPTINR